MSFSITIIFFLIINTMMILTFSFFFRKMRVFRMIQIRKLTVLLAIFSFGLITLVVISRNAVINDVDRVARL